MPRSFFFFQQPSPSAGSSPLVSIQRNQVKFDGNAGAQEMRMSLVAEREDAYWKAQFSKETYYAAGRGYDQYRPAYELGWRAVLEHPEAQFNDVVKQLELEWPLRRDSSLLPWREVQSAVKQAWDHAAQQVQVQQLPSRAAPSSVAQEMGSALIVQVLQPLYRACVLLADDVRRMMSLVADEFARQVLARHVRLLRKMAAQLKNQQDLPSKSTTLQPLKQRLRGHWQRLKLRLNEWDAAQVFEVCELREQSILAAYQSALRRPLPPAITTLLQQHVKLLQNNMDKLSWVRQNWMM